MCSSDLGCSASAAIRLHVGVPPPSPLCRLRAREMGRDLFHGVGDDYFFPGEMDGIGVDWAGAGSRPGVTEIPNAFSG